MVCLTKRLVAGIDPGVKGAWAILDEDGTIGSYGTYENRHEAELANCDLAVLEKVSARPGQGVVSVFTFGVSFGIWQGHLESYGTPFELITPQRWQKCVLDFVPTKLPKQQGETSKETQKRVAQNRYNLKESIVGFTIRRHPEMREVFSKKKYWDIADAICLAMYGVMKLKGLK